MCECVKHLGFYYSKKNKLELDNNYASVHFTIQGYNSIYLFSRGNAQMHAQSHTVKCNYFQKLNLNAQFKVYIGVKFYAI